MSDQADVMLIKFGQAQHLQEFRNGILYMNNRSAFFDTPVADTERHDPYEAVDYLIPKSSISDIRLTDELTGAEFEIGSDALSGPMRGKYDDVGPNVFCMYAAKNIMKTRDLQVDPQNFRFGDYYVRVINTPEFLVRVESGIRKTGFSGGWQLVEYVDVEQHAGIFSPFNKPGSLSHQNEFRIIVDAGSLDPIRLPIGCLKDITTPILPLAAINQTIHVRDRPPSPCG